MLIAGIGTAATQDYAGLTQANAGGNVQGLAALIFSQYLWAFELTSALLITAAIGAMILAHRERFERRKTQREMSVERFQPGGHPTPLPGPGVFARHNAVDTPARLPDGSPVPVVGARGLGLEAGPAIATCRPVTAPTVLGTVRHESAELPVPLRAAVHASALPVSCCGATRL